jgi:hypothetical protein
MAAGSDVPNLESSIAFPLFENRSRSSSTSSTGSVIHNPQPERRGRARSISLYGDNPLEVPITAAENQLSRLVSSINAQNEREQVLEASRQHFTANTAQFAGEVDQFPTEQTTERERESRERTERSRRKADLSESGGYRGTKLTRTSSSCCTSLLTRTNTNSELTSCS